MIAMTFTIELDIELSYLLQTALPQLVTDRETKLIVGGGPSDRTAIAGATLRPRERKPYGRWWIAAQGTPAAPNTAAVETLRRSPIHHGAERLPFPSPGSKVDPKGPRGAPPRIAEESG
jgi:hypothetical protein